MRLEVQEIEQMHQETRHRVNVECEAQHAFSCPCNIKNVYDICAYTKEPSRSSGAS